jgi:hypothetical protein
MAMYVLVPWSATATEIWMDERLAGHPWKCFEQPLSALSLSAKIPDGIELRKRRENRFTVFYLVKATTCDILPVSLQKRSLLRHHGPDRR